MMSFKELVEQDNRTVFMNLDEFADTHVINGKEIPCIIDKNVIIEREKRYQYKRSLYADGVYLKEVLLYVKAEDFGPLPAVGRALTLDKKSYIISDAIDEGGIYSISLEANKT